MWLLNSNTLKLEEFYSDVPPYAILSHRWEGKEEVKFGDLARADQHLRGHQKIVNACVQAQREGLRYIWVDTCCIGKRSSAELSEAINSMFRWYRNAVICYVHLNDVDIEDRNGFSKSSWFRRGWTLQELLAPATLRFFDRRWRTLGSRKDLEAELELITGIPHDALAKFRVKDHCIAQVMSWSNGRVTTREEDRAYSLLGLFDINMPLLYGEGAKAFERLQEEIMKVNTDMSIFLWEGRECDAFGMLAASPDCFMHVTKIPTYRSYTQVLKNSQGWVVNNAGISITAHIYPYIFNGGSGDIFLLPLTRNRRPRTVVGPDLVIFLQRIDTETADGGSLFYFQRVSVAGATWTWGGNSAHVKGHLPPFRHKFPIFIARSPLLEIKSIEPRTFDLFIIPSTPVHCRCGQRPLDDPTSALCEWPAAKADVYEQDFFHYSFALAGEDANGPFCHLLIEVAPGVELLICLGTDHLFQPLCVVVPLCRETYRGRLNAWDLVQNEEYSLLINTEEAHRKLDPEIHVIYHHGEDLAQDKDIGLQVDFRRNGGQGSPIVVRLNVEEHLQHYLQVADPQRGGGQLYASRVEDPEMLSQLDVAFYEKRRSYGYCR